MSRDLMMILRRTHLYAGLLMLPWVLLYGVTGLLFNHPTWFSDQAITTFGSAETRGTALEHFPNPGEIAGQVVAAINDREGGGYQLLEPGEARFERGGLSGNVIVDGQSYSVSLDSMGESGIIRTIASSRSGPGAASPGRNGSRGGREAGKSAAREKPSRAEEKPRAPESSDPLRAVGSIELSDSPLERMRSGLPEVFSKVGLSGASVSDVRAAALVFFVEASNQIWRASYDLQSGAISGRPVDEDAARAELTNRRFLLQLHKAHGYPSEFNAKWTWALIVDVTSAIMVFWGLSGVVMWWQIKRTRRLGTAALLVSVVAASWVFLEMHGMYLSLGR